MSAHLIATINTTTLRVERVGIYSQGPGSMSGISSGYAMAELIQFDGKTYSDAQYRMLEWLVVTYDGNPLKWAVPLLLEDAAGNLGNLFRPDAEAHLAAQAGSPFEAYLRLMVQLWKLAGCPTAKAADVRRVELPDGTQESEERK